MCVRARAVRAVVSESVYNKRVNNLITRTLRFLQLVVDGVQQLLFIIKRPNSRRHYTNAAVSIHAHRAVYTYINSYSWTTRVIWFPTFSFIFFFLLSSFASRTEYPQELLLQCKKKKNVSFNPYVLCISSRLNECGWWCERRIDIITEFFFLLIVHGCIHFFPPLMISSARMRRTGYHK